MVFINLMCHPVIVNRGKFPKPHAVVYDGQFLAYSTERLFETAKGKALTLLHISRQQILSQMHFMWQLVGVST